MKLDEVIKEIEAAKVKRDFMYELTPANKQMPEGQVSGISISFN